MAASDARRTARILGYAGLIPFYATAVGALFTGGAEGVVLLLHLQVTYGAVIASFLGGVYWGLAMDTARSTGSILMRSVVPGLAGWGIVIVFSFLIYRIWLPLILSIILFLALYANDRHAVRTGLLPGWYGALRAPLTVFVIVAYLIGIAAVL